MSDLAISVRSIGKCFRRERGHGHAVHAAFEGVVRAPFDPSSPLRRAQTAGGRWALKDVSFDVRQGECVALIGANGAGKSVLLRMLAGVTWPTCGEAELIGRVGVVLEVGAGFNRELTGRENVYLNGAVLGMRKREIVDKFDDIVAFSGLSEFIDLPLKTFSSGMSLRLAFAIAAHLDPEIVLMDEVLAVADEEFRRMCLERLRTFQREGRTILLASHDTWVIDGLCPRSLWLDNGTLVMDGETRLVEEKYAASVRP